MNSKPKTRLPDDTQRIVVIGRTGSGKTRAGVWHLSNQNFDEQPWIIFDYKTDDLINSIPNAEYVDIGFIPKTSGIYICQPTPEDDERINDYFREIWRNENIGVYADEGYMVSGGASFQMLLTQGRSKHIPMIINTQRPCWLSRFVFSEADFFQVFHLNDERDRKTVKAFLPKAADLDLRLPKYHSFYYDVGSDTLSVFAPVPPEEETLERFRKKLKPKRRTL